MTELEQIMLQALQDMQKSFKADLDDSERSFREALTDLSNTYTLQEQRWVSIHAPRAERDCLFTKA